jgi:hypothetical protein
MQQTRLNLLLTLGIRQITDFFANPWRKLSLIFVSLLLGFFVASAVSATTGQEADWDISIAAGFLIFTEITNMIVYRHRTNQGRSLWLEILNAFKIGFAYCLYLEALKLGS